MGQMIDAAHLFRRARMWLAGISHGGARDLYEQFGYKRTLDFRNFVAMYYRQGVAKRIIDAPVLGCWADPPQIITSNDQFNLAWDEILETRKLWHNIIRLDKLAGLGSFAVMVVGFDDGGKLDTPVRSKPGRKILYLQPYHEGAVQILAYETDNTSERFGKPVMYQISPGRYSVDGLQGGSLTMGANAYAPRQPFRCHWTRLVHVAENLLEDSIFGSSRLEPIFNDLEDILKVSGGSAEVYWLTANRGMQLDLDKDIELSPEDADDLKKEVDEYQHQLRRIIRTRGVKVTNLGSDPPNPQAAYLVLVQQISAGTGIPQLILMGASSGHLSSQQDRASWAERLAERVTEYCAPVVLKAVMDCFINAGVLPMPQRGEMEINWPEAFKMNPLERAQTSAQMARSAANLAKGHAAMAPKGADGNPQNVQPLFTPDEMRRMVSFGRHPPVFDSPQPSGGQTPIAGEDPVIAEAEAATAAASSGS